MSAPGIDQVLRLDDAVTLFLNGWANEGPRVPTADTVRNYTNALKWLTDFAAAHGRHMIADLDADFLRTAVGATLHAREDRSQLFKGGEAQARTLVCAARRMLLWLAAQGFTVPDLSAVRSPKVPERVQPRLTPDEFRRLQDAVLHQMLEPNRTNPPATVARDLALLYLLADTGLRASEVCSLTTADVDFERGRIRVRRGKGRKERLLNIVDPTAPDGGDTMRLLAEWIKVRERIRGAADHVFLFVSLKGNQFDRDGLTRLLRVLCKDAGLDSNRPCHAFRRATFTERYRANPEAIHVLAARMGWSPRSHHMVNVYTRGAELTFAEEVALPSMASQWGGNSGSLSLRMPAAPAPAPPAPPASKKSRPSFRDVDRKRLLAAMKSDPELREAMLEALMGGAV